MAKTNIEWTHQPDGSPGFTWNPLAGCTVLTPGCTNCYAMKLAARLGRMGQPLYAGLTKQTKGGAVWTGEMRRASDAVLMAPLKRKKPTTYFVNSMSDLFHDNVPDEWIDEIFAVMALCPQHTFQVLTKRANRMLDWITDPDTGDGHINCYHRVLDRAEHTISGDRLAGFIAPPWPLPNVWLGVSTERQQEADERIPLLLQTPAAIRFISAEPLLGPIDLNRIHEGYDTPEGARVDMWESCLNGKRFDMWAGDDEDPMQPGHPKLDWVIVGGESGHGYRPMAAEWAYSLRDQCMAAGVPVFIKQMAGREPIPADLQIRQFPN